MNYTEYQIELFQKKMEKWDRFCEEYTSFLQLLIARLEKLAHKKRNHHHHDDDDNDAELINFPVTVLALSSAIGMVNLSCEDNR